MIHRTRAALGALTLTAAAVLVAGCAAPAAEPTPTAVVTMTPTASPPRTATPTATTAAVHLPTSCDTLGSAATRAETVGDLRLQSDGEGFVRPAPQGATLALGCDWILDEVAGVLLLVSTATPEAVTAAVADLPSEGYTCQTSDDFGAQYCVLPGSGENTEEAIVARDGVWVYFSTVNRNGRAFLSEIVQSIFA